MKSLGPHALNTVIAGSFSPVDLNRCSRLPVAELEVYENLVTWFPKHQTFIAGGFASFAMGYTSDFSNVNVYVMCESSEDAGKLHQQAKERVRDMRKADRCAVSGVQWKIRCEGYRFYIYFRGDDGCNTLMDVKICVMPPHRHVGKFRYIDMLTVVGRFDMFQSMCIIDSVDLPGKHCSALALYQFQQAVADTDTRSLLAIQKRRDCIAAFGKWTPEAMFWDNIEERCARYKCKTQRPNLKIGVPRLSSICLSELLDKTRLCNILSKLA